MERLIPDTQSGLALDIGCGSGHYTKILTDKGWRTTAIDADSSKTEIVKRYAAETHTGDAINVLQQLALKHFDLVLSLEIIEHMSKRDAQTFLEKVCMVLKPGGHLLLSTPNRLSPEGLGGYYWGEKIRGWTKWNAWDPAHIHLYSSFEIIGFLKECGFSIKKITGYWYQGRLPIIGRWNLPFWVSEHWPFNRFGFMIILECRRQ